MTGGGAIDTVRVVPGPVCLVPEDAFTGRPPTLRVVAVVERSLGGGRWEAEEDVRVVTTATGAIVLPSLAAPRRTASGGAHGVRRMRIRLLSPYLLDAEHPEGVEFDAPSTTVPPVTRVRLYPLPAYPFPPGTRLLRGRVRRTWGTDVAGAALTGRARTGDGYLPRVLPPWSEYAATAADGRFRLPLRRPGSKPRPAGQAAPEPEWFTVTAAAEPAHGGGPEATVHLTAADISGTEHLVEIP
ncbi:hypothetical protein WEB32_32830 [Streptomyces netropsis]|uniref:hypothetical protein n=1 Tax=Streptomyces netropsis TaxID=55404 RepID=UPI0030D15E3D